MGHTLKRLSLSVAIGSSSRFAAAAANAAPIAGAIDFCTGEITGSIPAGAQRMHNDPSTGDTGSLGSVLDAGCYEYQMTIPDAPTCPGDSNNDGVIDINDLSRVLGNFGQNCN